MSRPLNDTDHRADYLGDGLYVDHYDNQVRLFSTDGIDIRHEVFLEPETLKAFEDWLRAREPRIDTPDALCLWKWECDFGRMGMLEAGIIASEKEVEASFGKTAYFGELRGKYSDISCTLQREQFTRMSSDPEFVKKWYRIHGKTISGYNPLDHISE